MRFAVRLKSGVRPYTGACMATDTCKNCGETIEVGYTICWECGTSIDGTPPAADFVPDALASSQEGAKRSLACLRCGTDMEFVRRMKLHEGSLLPGLLFDIGRLFTNRENFDTYACSSCGKVEFFL